jgi:hypothetical protein
MNAHRRYIYVRSAVLRAISMELIFFWVVTSYSLINGDGTYLKVSYNGTIQSCIMKRTTMKKG